ncbi:MAG: hypothetical protein Q4A32_04755 [Lachnospiraceae bacterium]|nr:hypothetical protein [Lachnospiraceae bacterium]
MSASKDVSQEFVENKIAKKVAKKKKKLRRKIRRHIFNAFLFFSLGLFIGMHWKAIRVLVKEKKLLEVPEECPWPFFKA